MRPQPEKHKKNQIHIWSRYHTAARSFAEKSFAVVWCKPPELRDVEDVDRSPPNAVSWTIQLTALSCQMDDELPRPLEKDNDQS